MKHITRVLAAGATVAAVATAAPALAASTKPGHHKKTGHGVVDITKLATTFKPGIEGGTPGRFVALKGAIAGRNFEPGMCIVNAKHPNCFTFTIKRPVAPGDFLRDRPGAVAYTTCRPCKVSGRKGSFILKIHYFAKTTHFTIQHARGGLKGLHGSGSLNLTKLTYTVTYYFSK